MAPRIKTQKAGNRFIKHIRSTLQRDRCRIDSTSPPHRALTMEELEQQLKEMEKELENTRYELEKSKRESKELESNLTNLEKIQIFMNMIQS